MAVHSIKITPGKLLVGNEQRVGKLINLDGHIRYLLKWHTSLSFIFIIYLIYDVSTASVSNTLICSTDNLVKDGQNTALDDNKLTFHLTDNPCTFVNNSSTINLYLSMRSIPFICKIYSACHVNSIMWPHKFVVSKFTLMDHITFHL